MAGEHDDHDSQGDWGKPPEAGAAPVRLDFAEDEGRLPWLESADDDFDDYDTGGSRLLGLVAVGALALVGIVGAIWWASNSGPDPDAVADGSVIAAPKEPYKVAPQDRGGKTFAGTGDSSYVVSEGQTRTARMGENAGAPPPGPSPSPDASGSSPAKVVPVGVGVQVGAYNSRDSAEAGWTRVTAQAGDVLSGVPHRVVEGSADIGKVYRLQAVAGDAAAANALCGRLKAAGVSCQVK
ncbi:sporulation related protein [Novosphingobium kunmingense]|uniref:Sporulation related protein n=1 Tax=Novosphingobium kunmingense TaxID=1211806 RepID=A0A2N0HKN6_9SPHN|nr:SPOR domain-containing protein [Novosphingobium kunmingense]PKB19523.1 sporulation related protein [Novosphingobium kunmingense]